ncbi:fibronectin/fibrinogen-binding protein [Clostridium sp. AF19-22AC]|jgi:predicted ribosome quality control (RQC) complex YloA/Tae2 family protein|uniref:Rqc2 family fibronectin-binding protein n=1 Tax=Clostridia TaxID=186801 RepID=UPI000E50E156|nr:MULTISPECIES: NFACT RNA binding domain-containing protein [Clostridia]RHR32345.1 fibronectin/fibrinogen-binding protein [Clostridium sp. AF19-22AC]
MAFDGTCVACLVHELKEQLLNSRIAKIAQPETDELLLTLKSSSGQKRLCISASASLPLIYLTDSNKPSPMTAPNFCMLLRKHISNGRIVDIYQPKLERIIHFTIEHLDELGDLCRKDLVVEIMGKHSNIIFCTEDGMVIDSIKHVSAQMSSVREVLPSREYFIPDTMEKSDPLSVEEPDFIRLLTEKPMPLSKAIYTSFTGVSPVVAEEVCSLSGVDSSVTPKELSEDILKHVYNQFNIFFLAVKENQFSPAIYYDGKEPKEFSALTLTHFGGYAQREFSSISEVLETYYASKNTITRIRQKSADLRHIVQTALERNRKKYDLQLKQLKDTENRDKYKVYGELINTYGYNLDAGAKKLEALNYYTNEMVTIPLDGTKTPQENAQRYFDKYNKQKRTWEALSKLIQETGDDITYLESISTALDIALTEDDLAEIKEELISAGYMRRKFTKKKVKIKNKPLHYISSDGFHIYVGKNNLQNDELTFSFAVGNDWWFHAKGAPGSHVIVKSEGEELPDKTFEEAGRLAAYYSKSRGSDKVEIDYIEKKHVKKPKGAKPGFVVYYTNYSLVIDSDISHIKELS